MTEAAAMEQTCGCARVWRMAGKGPTNVSHPLAVGAFTTRLQTEDAAAEGAGEIRRGTSPHQPRSRTTAAKKTPALVEHFVRQAVINLSQEYSCMVNRAGGRGRIGWASARTPRFLAAGSPKDGPKPTCPPTVVLKPCREAEARSRSTYRTGRDIVYNIVIQPFFAPEAGSTSRNARARTQTNKQKTRAAVLGGKPDQLRPNR